MTDFAYLPVVNGQAQQPGGLKEQEVFTGPHHATGSSTCLSTPAGAASSPAGVSSGSGGVTGGRGIPAGHSRSAGQWSENHWQTRSARRIVTRPSFTRLKNLPFPPAIRPIVERAIFRRAA